MPTIYRKRQQCGTYFETHKLNTYYCPPCEKLWRKAEREKNPLISEVEQKWENCETCNGTGKVPKDPTQRPF